MFGRDKNVGRNFWSDFRNYLLLSFGSGQRSKLEFKSTCILLKKKNDARIRRQKNGKEISGCGNAGMKFRNRGSSIMVYRHIPAHSEHSFRAYGYLESVGT
jgi:hypothetical protein